MERNNLIGDLIAMSDRNRQPRELTPSVVLRRTSYPPAAEYSCLLWFSLPWSQITQRQASSPMSSRIRFWRS